MMISDSGLLYIGPPCIFSGGLMCLLGCTLCVFFLFYFLSVSVKWLTAKTKKNGPIGLTNEFRPANASSRPASIPMLLNWWRCNCYLPACWYYGTCRQFDNQWSWRSI